MRLVYRVISCDGLGGSIACAWNSQMASSLSQIRVACSTMKMSSFPLEIVKNIHHEKLQVFTIAANPRSNKSSTAPQFSLRTDLPTSSTSLVFFSFLVESHHIGIEVSYEEEYSILRILYRYSLQQLIFLAVCNDFDTHYRELAYILLRNTTLLFPK